jgi:hypothetical protein
MDVDRYNDDYNPILMFVGLDDSKASRIIIPTMNLRKTVSEMTHPM